MKIITKELEDIIISSSSIKRSWIKSGFQHGRDGPKIYLLYIGGYLWLGHTINLKTIKTGGEELQLQQAISLTVVYHVK